MKYFSPSYWFKLWLLSAPLFNDETIGINAKSIDNKKIKDWASNNTNLQSINQDISFTNSSTNYQPYKLNQQLPNQNINPFYQTELETNTHKHRHEKSRNKREHVVIDDDQHYKFYNILHKEYLYAASDDFAYNNKKRNVFTWRKKYESENDAIWKLEKDWDYDNYEYFNIYNVHYKEYLYTDYNYYAKDDDRRRVFTWREKNKIKNEFDEQSLWKLQKLEDNQYNIYSVAYNECLYAASDYFAYDNDRRTVFTWRKTPNECVTQGLWKLEKLKNENDIQNDNDFYAKNKIEFFNNNFFYKFGVNYNFDYDGRENSDYRSWDSAHWYYKDEITIIKNWTKFANNWIEFEKKFPEIEFVNLFSETIGSGPTNTQIKNTYKIKTFLSKKSLISFYGYRNFFKEFSIYWNRPLKVKKAFDIFYAQKERNDYFISSTPIDLSEQINWHLINSYSYNNLGCGQFANIFIRLYPKLEKLKIENFYFVRSSACQNTPLLKLKYKKIRLVGEVDFNPLLLLTIKKAKQYDVLANHRQELLDYKEKKAKNGTYDIELLKLENKEFNSTFISWMIEIEQDYIRDLINIDQDNQLINLNSEIQNLNSTLTNFINKRDTCLDKILDSFKLKTLADAPGDTWKTIKENSESPLKVLIKESGKAFASGLLTGVAKGSALGVINCVAESLFASRKRREIIDINNLEEKPNKKIISNELQNITKWNDEFTKDINHEQHFPQIKNLSNYVGNNITNL